MIRINATDIGRELLYPFRERAIVYAMLFYWFLFWLAQRAGIIGIPLAAVTLPAYFRYLLYLLEARANGRRAPVPTIEMFTPFDNLWTLTPLIHVAIVTWAAIWLGGYDSRLATTVGALTMLLILPASLAVLAITHSPTASLNPLAMARMIRACGPAYFAIPVILFLLAIVFNLLFLADAPLVLVNFGTSYEFVLLFTLTGAVLHARQVAEQIDIGQAVERSQEQLAQDILKERQNVADHAYGFISRGNRQAGLAHIRRWLEDETAAEEAWQWFLYEMLKWENKDPALFFAQEYLGRLLEWRLHREALKLVARCLHESTRWRPLPEHRDAVVEIAHEAGREDLLRMLKD